MELRCGEADHVVSARFNAVEVPPLPDGADPLTGRTSAAGGIGSTPRRRSSQLERQLSVLRPSVRYQPGPGTEDQVPRICWVRGSGVSFGRVWAQSSPAWRATHLRTHRVARPRASAIFAGALTRQPPTHSPSPQLFFGHTTLLTRHHDQASEQRTMSLPKRISNSGTMSWRFHRTDVLAALT